VKWVKKLLILLHGVTIGSLATALGFYLQYNEWHPLVVASAVTASIEIALHGFMALAEVD